MKYATRMVTPVGLILVACLIAMAQGQPQAQGIEWGKDLDAAMAQSAKDGRPVITYFTFDA